MEATGRGRRNSQKTLLWRESPRSCVGYNLVQRPLRLLTHYSYYKSAVCTSKYRSRVNMRSILPHFLYISLKMVLSLVEAHRFCEVTRQSCSWPQQASLDEMCTSSRCLIAVRQTQQTWAALPAYLTDSSALNHIICIAHVREVSRSTTVCG
jgi:hypothetical protein